MKLDTKLPRANQGAHFFTSCHSIAPRRICATAADAVENTIVAKDDPMATRTGVFSG